MRNLFSVLTEAQLNSLSKEERDSLYAIDQKLFPDGNGGGGGGDNDWLKNKLSKMDAERKETENYAKQMEESFV